MKEIIDLNRKCIFVTGAAGFIGANLILALLKCTDRAQIIGIDCLTDYNPIEFKEYRLNQIIDLSKQSKSQWEFYKLDITNKESLRDLFSYYKPDIVVNLAAQAGVRYSITNPEAYLHTNIDGFFNVLECCRNDRELEHFVYASSSSVYGMRTNMPFKESDDVMNPASLYAATKSCNEILAYSYSKLYGIPSTGLRFFTVYGPAGRSDMAYFLFAEKLKHGEKISVFNYGNCQRDFTYVDDIVKGIINVMQGAPTKFIGKDGLSVPPYDIYNIGNSHPVNLMDFISVLSEELIRVGVLPDDFKLSEHLDFKPMQPGDVPVTYADLSKLEKDYGYKPNTELRVGLRKFSEWYKEYTLMKAN